MFEPDKKRYLTRGVNESIPMEVQIFLWNAIDSMPEPKIYLQVFRLSKDGDKQHIVHESEVPEYKAEYDLSVTEAINEKIFVIDDGVQCTMLLAAEY